MNHRVTLWLKVNGKVNTLRRHFINAGYRAGYETSVAKRCKCKPSEIPLQVIADYLGAWPTPVEMPDNWQEIMYGSKRGAQKNRKGAEIRYPEERQQYMKQSERVEEFLTMRLTPNPSTNVAYY